jgi:hypothetical protein
MTSGGEPQRLGTYPAADRRRVDVAATPERLTVTTSEYECYSDDCKYQDYSTVFTDLITGPAEGPLTSVRSCIRRCDSKPCEDVMGASGHVVLFTACVYGAWRLHDFATGQDVPIPHLERAVIAGDFIANNDYSEITLHNWRTNTKVLSVPVTAASPWIALQADGKLAYADGDRTYPQQRELLVVSPSAPTPKRVLLTGADLRPLAFAGDRILYQANGTRIGRPVFGVVGLDGRDVVPERTGTNWTGFDGRRLVGVDTACGLDGIVEWDLQGEVPSLPAGQCPAMTVARASRNVTRTNALRVKVACPAAPALGCRGSVSVIASPKPKRSPRPSTIYVSVAPGESTVATVRLPWSSLCRPKRGKVTLSVETTSGGGDQANPAGRWKGRLSVGGVKKIPRACGR